MAKHPISNSPDLNNSNGDPQSMEKLKQAAGYIIGAILLALAGYFGWTYFQNSGMKEDTVAADKYAAIEKTNDELMGQPEGNADVSKKLNADIDKLVAEHGNTVYAWQALMIKSRNAVDANDMKNATEALKKALEIDLKDPGLHSITQLRYATVLLADGNVDEALTQASKDVPVAFEASQQELLGDIYSAKKDKEKALRAYQNAWSLLSKRHEERPFLRLKLENLGINPEPIEPADQIVDVAALQQSQDAAQAQSNAELEAVAAELAGGSSEGTAQ
ncbi:YfgM family protein [Psychrobacter sanguinis]|uniref:YfgM family protein n=1 Tax=Psychrobacter sanguinis TaxID=861445 RepID=UPI00191AD6D9|nr:tetratricopeptide repeat protein [Psychrobacter sanguinis]MCC3307036.1 tetratricopeptide repeat protein [Psychrobacter sanguinis]UEC24411.1 tetratricopeptide repeat protein [Psychrobacter sanguinis]